MSMDYRRQLYLQNQVYNHRDTDQMFLNAVRRNVEFHREHCASYDRILRNYGFETGRLKTAGDLWRLPCIPTLYFKRNRLASMDSKKLLIRATSSGTGGLKTQLGYEGKGLFYGAVSVLRTACFHRLLSAVPVNYLILGYEPHKSNQTVISKTQRGSTLFAPGLGLEYALKYGKNGYYLDKQGMKRALRRFAFAKAPVRIIGFPSYLYFLLMELVKEGLAFSMPKGSMVMLGGGWKQHYKEQVDKEELYRLIEERLGIPEERVREFFGVAEHPVLYCDCKNHHFHVPSYSRVIIRDADTLKPVGYEKPGLVNLISPLMESMPLASVMTDDLGILHEGRKCGCGIETPYLEIIGRVGIPDIVTCAAGAKALMRG